MSLWRWLVAWLARRHAQAMAEAYSPRLTALRAIQDQPVKKPASVVRLMRYRQRMQRAKARGVA